MKVIEIVLTTAGFLNAISVIINCVINAKKPAEKAIQKKLSEILEPLDNKMDDTNKYIKKIDKNECMNFLVNFLADVENGDEKDDVQTKRACEVYDHYVKDLQGNSYIHDKWTRVMIEGGKI